MSGSKRNIREKITLFILMLLASPFIIGILLLFVLVYIVVYPFEILLYKNSFYFKDLNDKYYLFVTLNKKYKIYNKIRKLGKEDFINNEKVIKCEKFIIHYFNKTNIILTDEKLTIVEDNDLINFIVINKKELSDEQFKTINKQNNVIIYDKKG